jgi:voltage-gated potassium channel
MRKDIMPISNRKSFREKLEVFLYSTPAEILVYLLIILSVGMIAVEISQPEMVTKYHVLFEYSELLFIGFFSIEYVLKLVVAKDKWLFFRRYFIDLLAILPFLRFFRLFRGFRILRLLRVVRLLRLGNMVARQISKMEGARNLREVIIILVVFLSTVLAGSIGILMFEREIPDTHFTSLGDGLWWCFVTITTVGYGDKYPQTPEGKVLGGIIMLVGLSFYGLVAGLGSNFIISRLKKGSEWMVSTFINHTVILGVNEKLPRIVNLLLDMGQRVVVVTENVDRVPQYPEHLVAVVEGDFLDEQILMKARVNHATNAIILTDLHNRRPKDADVRAILAALAVEKMKPEVNTVVEAISADTEFHLHHAKVDDVVQSGALTAEMLAFSTDHPGYSDNLHILLRFVHQNRVSITAAAAHQVGEKIFDLQIKMATEQKILLGIKRGEEELMDAKTVVEEGDQIICVDIL